LIEIIRRKIAKFSEIHTDCWKGYNRLDEICSYLGYIHKTVNHSENFVNNVTGANTQTIEGMWSVIKRELRKEGTKLGDINTYLKKIYFNSIKKITVETY
jgi:hypothetical protein